MHKEVLKGTRVIIAVVVLIAVSRAVAQPAVTAPPNTPAEVSWDAEKGELRLSYHGVAILDAVIVVEDKEGKKTGAGIKLAPKDTPGEKVEQRLTFTLAEPKEGLALVLRATVLGSEEAFPAETLSEAQERFPYVRNSVGMSWNLRNNAIYDRRLDWVLLGPGDGKTRIKPGRKEKGSQTFSLESRDETIELVFRPRFYQKHLGFYAYEPWTYKVWKGSLTGYCTWWAYRGGFTQEVLEAMLKVFVEKHLPDFGYDYMQFDDCYQQGNGSSPHNWLNWDKRKYPGGWKYALEAIREAGMKPGIWVHRVHRPSDPGVKDIIERHPDWFVPGADGKPHQQSGFCSLNTHNEEAVENMIRALYRGLAKQGWDYVKIDGTGDLLRAYQNKACAEFFTNNPTTPEQSLRKWDVVAREELGSDVYVLACHTVGNARHVIGLVDGARLSNDGFQPRTLAQYNFLEGVVWRNDPDHCDVLGEWLMDTDAMMPVFSRKEPVPVRTVIRPAICAMAGGVLMVSDKVEVYQDDRNIEGMKRSAPVLFTVPGQLYGCGRRTVPWWLQEIDRPFDHWSVLARIQWGEKREKEWVFDFKGASEQEVQFADLGLHEGREYLVFEFWSQKFLGKFTGSFTAPEMDENTGMHVFAIREARPHPWVLSTTRHLSQGGVSLLDERWDEQKKTLSGKSALVIDDPYVLTIHVPTGFRLERAEVEGERVQVANKKETATVRVVPSATRTVEWKATFTRSEPESEPALEARAKYLLLDKRVVETVENAELKLGTVAKHSRNPLFGEDKPWEQRVDNMYPSVIRDEADGRYKCWYCPFIYDASAKGMSLEERREKPYRVPRREDGVCYATSSDGLAWEKPELGLVEYEGSKANNLVVRSAHGAGVFKDLQDPSPERRYKMFHARDCLRFSADGLRWSEPVQCEGVGSNGDTHNHMLWAPDLKRYVAFVRLRDRGQRLVGRTESVDLERWTRAAEVLRNNPRDQAYSMPVFRYADVYLGLVAIFRTAEDRVHTELAWSPNTVKWHRIEPGTPLIGNSENEGDYDWGCVYAGDDPVVLDDEIRIYYLGSNGKHTSWRDGFFCLATLRPDGWAGYEQTDSAEPGVVITRAIPYDGKPIQVTADVKKGGSVKVFALDRDGTQLGAARPVTETATNAKLQWTGNIEADSIRLRFELRGAKVYSFGSSTGGEKQASTVSKPPMGWNSYTGYSIAVTEDELLKNIDFLSGNLLHYGYDTVTVDNGWFLSGQGKGVEIALDAHGRPESHEHFFPRGLKYTIDYAHKKGVKFGIWLLRGINRRAVEENLPVEGTKYRMRDIVNMKSRCPWAVAPWWNYGVDMTKPGAQEYYDGLIRKYADMGVDFIKFDDIVPNPDEVEAVAKAIARCDRKIVLSLSPGDHIKVEHSDAYKRANMVRITSDIWDNRGSLETTFRRWEAMQDYTGPEVGSFLDMDMVCFGRLYVTRNGGWECKFTEDQKRTFMVQRALAASPLMLGGVLYTMDEFSLSLFTHPDILQCNRNAVIGKLVYREGKVDVWKTPERGNDDSGWIGIFNRDGKNKTTIEVGMRDLGLKAGRACALKDLWAQKELPAGDRHTFEIPADGVAFLRYEQSIAGESGVSLTAVQPLQQTGDVSKDRSPEKAPLDLGDMVYATGLGVRAGSELTYDVSEHTGRFEAWVGIDPNVSAQRSGRFRAYADQDLVFDSGVVHQAAKRGSTQNPTRPIRVVVPLGSVERLRLTFQCEDDKDQVALCGGWGDAKFVLASAPEYQLGTYQGTTLAQTPPMGWNSWCRYGTDINEELIKKVADAMVTSGMRDAGYVYVNLDDGWQARGAKFDDKGYPLWDTEKFPSSMKALGDYLHARGLKFGIYSRAGWVRGHETQFAERFAEWGVDLVKYDFSNKEQQKATLDAIRAAGRDVVFSVCEWGRERPWLWAPGFNAEMWRTTYDVKDKWTSKYDNNGGIGVLRSAHQNEALGPFVGPGRWNDMDMLQIGVDGFDYGHDRKKAGFDITPDEERFQMSLWSILASPLLAANDVTAMKEQTRSILLNKEVIAVNQDPLGVPGWRIGKMDEIEVWKRPLKNGDIAVVFVNLGEEPRDIDVTWAQLNIRGPREVTDLWAQRSLGQQDKLLKFEAVPSHGVVFVRLSQ